MGKFIDLQDGMASMESVEVHDVLALSVYT
jgi:hypothetical protein